jgi:hypothetical protein
VAAVWYAESLALADPSEISPAELQLRKQWLSTLLKALPSCFCNPDRLR